MAGTVLTATRRTSPSPSVHTASLAASFYEVSGPYSRLDCLGDQPVHRQLVDVLD